MIMRVLSSISCLIAILFIVSADCLAMRFESTKELGSIATLPPYGAFIIEGAISNKGKLSTEVAYKSGNEYAKGVATFGSSENILYVYYDNSYVYTEDFSENVFRSKELANSCKMGGSSIKDTLILPMGFPHSCSIYQINNDVGLQMYLLEYDKGAVPSYKFIGKNLNGNWVRYFETTAAEQYYSMKRAFCHSFSLDGDTIIFKYGRYDIVEKAFVTSTELRFIWNDNDQWFGVECINN